MNEENKDNTENIEPQADRQSQQQETSQPFSIDEFKKDLEKTTKQTPEKPSVDEKEKNAQEDKDTPPADKADKADKTAQGKDQETSDSVEVSDKVRAWAKQLGFSDSEIKDFKESDVKAVEKAGPRLSKKMSELGREKPAKADSEPTKTAKDGGEEGKDVDKTDPKGSSGDQDGLEFTDDDWGDENGTKKLNTLARTVTRLEQENKELRSHLAAQQENKNESAVEKFFESLEGQWDPETRADIMEEAAVIRAGHAAIHGEEMPIETSLQKAMKMVEQPVKQTAAPEDGKTTHKAITKTPRPSHRDSEPRYGSEEAQAAAKLQSVLAKRGITVPLR